MKFPPVYTFTPSIKQLLYDLDVLKAGYALHPVPAMQVVNLRRASLLKSSLYSARIEGNPSEDVDLGNRDIANLARAYEELSDRDEATIDWIENLHRTVMENISGGSGRLRAEDSAIFNMAGVAVYLTPAPQNIRNLLADLCAYVTAGRDPAPIRAGVTHIWFEKIHPFLDGNGRVGRLLSAYILKKGGYDFSGLVPFEQYLDEHRDDYYYFLKKDVQDVTEFVEFYLTALFSQAKISLTVAYESGKPDKYALLAPRRAEIMRLIEDHKIVTFDFLSRRFRAVPVRTLHYDLSQLIKAGLVQKMGATRGVSYTLRNT